MAVRKTSARRTTKKPPLKTASKGRGNRMPASFPFRLFLLIVMSIAFFTLVQIIKKNVTLTRKTTETEQQQEQSPEQTPTITAQNPPVKQPEKEPDKAPVAQPQAQTQEKPQTEKPATPVQPSTPPAPVSTPPAQTSQPAQPAETRDRSIYLIQEANNNLVQVKVNRKLNVSNTPLTDSVNALLAGPTADERRRGMISLVPEGSRLLSAPRVEGGTVYLDFNQEFRYNTRGSEGCAAQIKQIVWTATEFSNVQDVQFLIEGNKVKFLSEGVVIDSPIGR
jgi:spore germination protein GerM